jgi:hypothetical protein
MQPYRISILVKQQGHLFLRQPKRILLQPNIQPNRSVRSLIKNYIALRCFVPLHKPSSTSGLASILLRASSIQRWMSIQDGAPPGWKQNAEMVDTTVECASTGSDRKKLREFNNIRRKSA